jgi:hypothetical protein
MIKVRAILAAEAIPVSQSGQARADKAHQARTTPVRGTPVRGIPVKAIRVGAAKVTPEKPTQVRTPASRSPAKAPPASQVKGTPGKAIREVVAIDSVNHRDCETLGPGSW